MKITAIEKKLYDEFGLEEVQQDGVLASRFVVIYAPSDEMEPSVTDISKSLKKEGYELEDWDIIDVESHPARYHRLVFRKDDQEEIVEWLEYHGAESDYEEALRQQRWF